jgi:hypothetical protein
MGGRQFPLPDEPFVKVWREYEQEGRRVGTAEVLKEYLVELKFPVRQEVSETRYYRAATRSLTHLNVEPRDDGLQFEQPDALDLTIHPTPAGCIPVITTGSRSDFERLVQALTRKNSPKTIPESMGAIAISGYRNWDRIRRIRDAHAQDADGTYTDTQWISDFQALQTDEQRYQDRFIILSSGPYSAVPAEAMNLEPDVWRSMSVQIRREHESAHYFTRRVFGSMHDTLHDELLADYLGVTAAIGQFDASWFLRFMGLENFPSYRRGGRLENYRGDPPLSDSAFEVLQLLIVRAAHQLEEFDRAFFQGQRDVEERAVMIGTLIQLTLEELAASDAVDRLEKATRRAEDCMKGETTTPGDS